ncbi:MAG: hypothetical protein M0P66_04930 [Salinivirgaceae bacterium]|nr:hypothetical protein [Salinivirgaceae bacterium]
MKQIYLLLGIIIIFQSCDNCEKEAYSGKLKVKVLTLDKAPVTDVYIHLYDEEYKSLYYYITDNEGTVDFGDLLQGSYLVYPERPMINGMVYQPSVRVQVINGKENAVEVFPENYVGNAEIVIKHDNGVDRTPWENLNIILLRAQEVGHSDDLNYYIENAMYKTKLDSTGKITLNKLPSDINYLMIAYTDENSLFKRIYSFSVNTGWDFYETIILDDDLTRII